MQKEQILIDNLVHVYNRGSRKMPIVYDEADKWRFLKSLYYLNDEYAPANIFHHLKSKVQLTKYRNFQRPKDWPTLRPLVKILSYCLMPNHFHLLLRQITENGISKFMARFSDSFTKYINIKHDMSGRLFQGSYQSKLVKTEKMLWHTDAYIQVFNPFELYDGGLERATEEFDKAFKFALEYPFCSLGESFGKRNLHIIDRDVLGEIWSNTSEYKEFAQEAIIYHNNSNRKVLKVKKLTSNVNL